jgi:hypothetical protein
MPMPRLASRQHRAIENIERSEQRGRAAGVL